MGTIRTRSAVAVRCRTRAHRGRARLGTLSPPNARPGIRSGPRGGAIGRTSDLESAHIDSCRKTPPRTPPDQRCRSSLRPRRARHDRRDVRPARARAARAGRVSDSSASEACASRSSRCDARTPWHTDRSARDRQRDPTEGGGRRSRRRRASRAFPERAPKATARRTANRGATSSALSARTAARGVRRRRPSTSRAAPRSRGCCASRRSWPSRRGRRARPAWRRCAPGCRGRRAAPRRRH